MITKEAWVESEGDYWEDNRVMDAVLDLESEIPVLDFKTFCASLLSVWISLYKNNNNNNKCLTVLFLGVENMKHNKQAVIRAYFPSSLP